jgi:hypothetical protein
MRFFHSESFLLLAAASLSLSSAVDISKYITECDSLGWDLLTGGFCPRNDCTSRTCRQAVDNLIDECSKDGAYHATFHEIFSESFAESPCVSEMIVNLKNYSNGKEFGTPIEPVVTSACADQGGKPILWGNKGQPRSCKFAKKFKKRKCKKFNTAEVCPKTCGECDGGSTTEPSDCEDSKGKVVPFKNKPNKTCGWVKKNTKRCDKNGVAELCPKTCGMC